MLFCRSSLSSWVAPLIVGVYGQRLRGLKTQTLFHLFIVQFNHKDNRFLDLQYPQGSQLLMLTD
jgi:hypothetical protein